MGRILTPAMYRRQFDRCTPSGVMFDDVIRLGIEEPGIVIADTEKKNHRGNVDR